MTQKTEPKQMREIVKACVKAGLRLYIAPLTDEASVKAGRARYSWVSRNIKSWRNVYVCCAFRDRMELEGKDRNSFELLGPSGEHVWYLLSELVRGEWSRHLRETRVIPRKWLCRAKCEELGDVLRDFRLEWIRQMREEFNRQAKARGLTPTKERKDEKA